MPISSSWKWMEKLARKIGIKSCPCCGESRSKEYNEKEKQWFGINYGPDSSDTYGVTCCSCGLRMITRIAYDWSEDTIIETEKDAEKAYLELEKAALEEAIKKWNERANEV